MSISSALLNGILGVVFPPYSILSGIVRYVVEDESSGFPVLLSTTLSTFFPIVGDIVGEIITEEIAEAVEKKKFAQLLKKYPVCTKCGQVDPYGLFNSKGERLCRACFRKLTNKIMLVASNPVKCEKCGKLTKQYFIDNGVVLCEACLTSTCITPISLFVVREASFNNIIKKYSALYTKEYGKAYNKKYKKGY